MHIQDIFAAHATTFSFEFFPPRTPEASELLFQTISHLEALKPSFVDVTYGAGGGTRDLTNDLVLRIRRETKLETIPHLTCVCHSEKEINDVLEKWAASGVSYPQLIDRLIALAIERHAEKQQLRTSM
jgi:methylenetetrahydrofolate reductase (NADPH)